MDGDVIVGCLRRLDGTERQLVVPSPEHLNHLPGLAALSRELPERGIGGRVWIAGGERT